MPPANGVLSCWMWGPEVMKFMPLNLLISSIARMSASDGKRRWLPAQQPQPGPGLGGADCTSVPQVKRCAP